MKYLGYFLGFIWSLPLTILGIALALVYWPKKIRWSKGCLELVGVRVFGFPQGASGAQTHGIVIWHTDTHAWDYVPLKVHERAHVIQSFIGGIFYAIFYVLDFLVRYVKIKLGSESDGAGDGPDWKRAYRKIIFERLAYDKQRKFQEGKIPDAWGA